MFYIKAKITLKVAGISGPFSQIISALVHGVSTTDAQSKFEAFAKQKFAHMHAQDVQFEYIEVAGEIK